MRLTESQLRKIVRQEIVRETAGSDYADSKSAMLLQRATQEWGSAQSNYPRLAAFVGKDKFIEEWMRAYNAPALPGQYSRNPTGAEVLAHLAEEMV